MCATIFCTAPAWPPNHNFVVLPLLGKFPKSWLKEKATKMKISLRPNIIVHLLAYTRSMRYWIQSGTPSTDHSTILSHKPVDEWLISTLYIYLYMLPFIFPRAACLPYSGVWPAIASTDSREFYILGAHSDASTTSLFQHTRSLSDRTHSFWHARASPLLAEEGLTRDDGQLNWDRTYRILSMRFRGVGGWGVGERRKNTFRNLVKNKRMEVGIKL